MWLIACIATTHGQESSVASIATRRNFTDSNSGLHWRFDYVNGTIGYSFSLDGEVWNKRGALPSRSPYFSLAYKNVGGVSYVLVAIENDSYGVTLFRGVLSGRDIRFNGEREVFSEISTTERYAQPAVSLDRFNRIWLAAIREGGSGERYQVHVTRSLTTLVEALTFAPVTQVGRASAEISSLSLVPGVDDEMVLALCGESYSNVVVYYYSRGAWSEAMSGGNVGELAFAGAGMNGQVRAMAMDAHGNLYVGGDFTTADGIVVNRVAVWSGSRWRPLGSGTNGPVYALAVDVNGSVYAGGSFTTAGGISVNNIARWDGSSWNGLKDGANGDVRSLVMSSSGALYAGGNFTEVDGTSARRIARWSGEAWSPLGSGLDQAVYGIAVVEGALYAVGAFSRAGDVVARGVAQWDGSRWSPCGSGVDGVAYAVAVDARGNLYVGGSFESAGGVTARNVSRWDGRFWSALGQGVSAPVAPGGLVVGRDSRLYVGGYFERAGTVPAKYVASWSGDVWTALQTGVDAPVSALLLSPNDVLIVGGDFQTVGGQRFSRVAQWRQGAWGGVTGAGLNGVVRALAVHSNGDLYVGGNFTEIGGVQANGIARWSGGRWYALGSGVEGEVFALALDRSGRLFIGGEFARAGSVAASNVAMWSGSAWTALAQGVGGTVHAIAVDAQGQVFVGGAFVSAGDIPVGNIAAWTGSGWRALGAGFDDVVLTLTLDSMGRLYAGGSFLTAGRLAARRVARWDAGIWSSLGNGMDGPVRSLVVDSMGTVYAGGDFLTAGAANARYIAQWNGGQWQTMEGGVSGPVHRLAVNAAGAVYASGKFIQAGSVVSGGLALWSDQTWKRIGTGALQPITALVVDERDTAYAGGSSSLFMLRRVAVAEQSQYSSVGLLSTTNGETSLFYRNHNRQAFMRTLSATPRRWGPERLIYAGSADSIAAESDPRTGEALIWIRDGAQVLFTRVRGAASEILPPQPVENGVPYSAALGNIETQQGTTLLTRWKFEAAGTSLIQDSSGPAPTPTPYVVDFQIVRDDLPPAPRPLEGVWVEIREEMGSVPVAVHRVLTGRGGQLTAPLPVNPQSDLVIQSGEPSIVSFQLSGAAEEFAPERNVTVVATPLIEPLEACLSVSNSEVRAVFAYRNHNVELGSSYLSVTGITPELYGEVAVSTDDLLTNSIDYSSGQRVIPSIGLREEPGYESKQEFSSGEGKFSVPFDPGIGPLTWTILGAAVTAEGGSPACPEQSSQECAVVQQEQVQRLLAEMRSTGREVTRAAAKIDRAALRVYRVQAVKAIRQARATLANLVGAWVCPAGAIPKASCSSAPIPFARLMRAHKTLFAARGTRGGRNLKRLQRTKTAAFQEFMSKSFPSAVFFCR